MENLTGEEGVAAGEQRVMPSAPLTKPQLGKLPVLLLLSRVTLLLEEARPEKARSGRVPKLERMVESRAGVKLVPW